jgi:uncharacterized protein with HEPN domain
MSEEREVTDELRDILEAAEDAEQFAAGMDFDAFAADKKTVFAVIRALEIIGEATKRIPTALRQRYPVYRGERWPGCATNLPTTTSE